MEEQDRFDESMNEPIGINGFHKNKSFEDLSQLVEEESSSEAESLCIVRDVAFSNNI